MDIKIEYDEKGISPDTIKTLYDYIEEKKPINAFLKAVLSNDLKEAYVCGNHINLLEIPAIIQFMCVHAPVPATCWGSTEKVEKWLEEVSEMDRKNRLDSEFNNLENLLEQMKAKTLKIMEILKRK